MIQISPEYLWAKQAADYLGIAYSTLKKHYPKWEKYGVVARRYDDKPTTGKLKFKRSELDHLMDQWKTIRTSHDKTSKTFIRKLQLLNVRDHSPG